MKWPVYKAAIVDPPLASNEYILALEKVGLSMSLRLMLYNNFFL